MPLYPTRPCAIVGCTREAPIYCPMHQQRVRSHGEAGEANPRKVLTDHCLVEGCPQAPHHKGYCTMHFMRLKNHGDVGPVGRIRRERGSGAIEQGYKTFKVADGRKSEHRMVWEAANGPVPQGHVIHHKNGNKLDNGLSNLVLMTRAEHRRHHYAELLAGKRK